MEKITLQKESTKNFVRGIQKSLATFARVAAAATALTVMAVALAMAQSANKFDAADTAWMIVATALVLK